jgi:hypothetical protein
VEVEVKGEGGREVERKEGREGEWENLIEERGYGEK